MKTFQMLLGGAIMLLMMPTFAQDADVQNQNQSQAQAKPNDDSRQRLAAVVSQQATAMAGGHSFKNNDYLNVQTPINQPKVVNRGGQQDDNGRTRQIPVIKRAHFNNDDIPNRNNHAWRNDGWNNSGWRNDSWTSNRWRNDGWNNNRGDDYGWRNRDRVTVGYRTTSYPSYFDSDRLYTASWTSYGWRERGWRVDYQRVDPYWFAIVTNIAIAQAWSDAQVARAINDDNLRQQLIEDEDIRQQMIVSGYPRDQVYYPPRPQTFYSTSPPVLTTPNLGLSPNPNSPLYSAMPLASGEQIANHNANKNVLFFCHFGNKQQTAEAFRQLQSPDMSVWKNVDRFNKCRAWAGLP